MNSELQRVKQQRNELLIALNKIANWELPETGKFWDEDPERPMTYEACYGSNGCRDYFKSLANSPSE